jgi:hypothetical protein
MTSPAISIEKRRVRIYSSGRTKTGYRYNVINISDLGQPEEAANQWVFDCPWCVPTDTKSSKPGKKLYYDPKKHMGFCVRCNIAIFPYKEPGSKKQEKLVDISQFSWFNYIQVGENLDLSWTETALVSQEVKEYLQDRKGEYDLDTISKYNIRFFEGVRDETVIVLPNSQPGRLIVDSFQTTPVIRNPWQLKYMTYSHTKVIYFLNLYENAERIYLVEGIFDGIASGGCPLMGKTLSKSQSMQLYEFFKRAKVKEVFIVLDGEVERERKIKTGSQVLRVNSGVKVYYTDLPMYYHEVIGEMVGMDPEEAVAAKMFDECVQNNSYRVFL